MTWQRAVYLMDGSAQRVLCTTAQRQRLQMQRDILPNHNMLTLGQPAPGLTLESQVLAS